MRLDDVIKEKVQTDMESVVQAFQNIAVVTSDLDFSISQLADSEYLTDPEREYLRNELYSVFAESQRMFQYFTSVLSNEEIGKEWGFYDGEKRIGARLATQAAVALEGLLPDNPFDELGRIASHLSEFSPQDLTYALVYSIDHERREIPAAQADYLGMISNKITEFVDRFTQFRDNLDQGKLKVVIAITQSPQYPAKTN